MSRISSATDSAFALRGTLARLDRNGDGVLSREELEADERPGILSVAADDSDASDTQTALGNIIAMLMESPASGSPKQLGSGISLMVPAAGAGSDIGITLDSDLQAAMDAYRGTYGQNDIGEEAA